MPTQALFFLNDPLVHGAAASWASALEQSTTDRGNRIVAATQATLARAPESDELAAANAFLDRYREVLAAEGVANPDHEALAAWLRTILAGNEFLHVD